MKDEEMSAPKPQSPVGILGMGVCVPPVIRPNAAWDDEVVAMWKELQRRHAESNGPQAAEEPPGVRLALRHALASLDDPFVGIAQRHVAPADMTASDMETAAAMDALRAAEIEPRDLGLIVCASAVPDQLTSNNACLLHHRLAADPGCTAIWIDGACNAFLLGLSLAVPMLQAGAVRYALLVQSSTISRVLDYTRPGSQYFGDGATAAVVGAVSTGRGMMTCVVSRTDGSLHAALAVGRRGRPWYGEGRAVLYAPDPAVARRFVLSTLDTMCAVAHAAFESSGFGPADIDFVATHQAFPWMRLAMKDFLGLGSARDVDAFGRFGNCFGATLPLVLAMGSREGLLRDGDLVFMGGLGAGATASAALVRWGA